MFIIVRRLTGYFFLNIHNCRSYWLFFVGSLKKLLKKLFSEERGYKHIRWKIVFWPRAASYFTFVRKKKRVYDFLEGERRTLGDKNRILDFLENFEVKIMVLVAKIDFFLFVKQVLIIEG